MDPSILDADQLRDRQRDGTAHYLADNWLQRGADLPLRGFN